MSVRCRAAGRAHPAGARRPTIAPMHPVLGWALALLFIGLAWRQYGWQGVVFALSVCVFWLLLQFNRTMRVMRSASSSPVGHVDSAVMLHARLKPGLPLMQVVSMAKSLGRKLSDEPERYEWTDDSGARLTVALRNGRCESWELHRDAPEPPSTPAP